MPTPVAKKSAKKTPTTEATEPKKPKATRAAKALAPDASSTEAVQVPAKKTGVKAASAKPAKAPVKKAKSSLSLPEPEALPEAQVAEVKPKGALAPANAQEAAEAPAGLPAHAATILTALREQRPLEFIFSDGDANPPRTFEPRHLLFDTLSQAWFVWGWDRRYNAERHHRVDALAEVNAVEGMGRSAQGPYKEGTPANQLGGWLGGEAIPVKATLMKQWIFAVKQAPPAFPEFKITDAEEGKATVTFTATDLRAISRWCMQFGDGIQIQEPQRLVERLKQAGTAWGGKPATAPAPQPPAKHASRHEASSGAEHAGPKGGAHAEGRRDEPKREPRQERHREERHEPRREEAKPTKSNPKVEIRIERL